MRRSGSRAAIAVGTLLLVACEKEPQAPRPPLQAASSEGKRPDAEDRRTNEIASNAFSATAKKSLEVRGETPRPGGTMLQSVAAEYRTLNNLLRTTGSEESFCRQYLFPPLLDIDPDTLELVPLLAQSRPTVSADRLTYTWKLRPGVRWQRGLPDGTPVEVTTADVEFSWRMMSNPKVNAAKAMGDIGPVKSIRALDRTTFVVETTEPYYKSELEVGYNFRLMPAHLCAQDPEGFNTDPLGRAPVGYGPYRFEEWRPGEYVALTRNPDWFGTERLPYPIEKVRVHFIKNLDQIPEIFQRGDLCIAPMQDAARFEALKEDPAFREIATFHEYYLTQWILIVWNHRHFAFADPRVRRAMTLLYPRETVVEKKYCGHAQVISGPWPRFAKEYDASVAPLPFDPVEAKRLLAEAGFADHDGDGLLDKEGHAFRFELKHPATSTQALDSGNLWFQEQLKLAGIEMTIRPVDSKQLFGGELSDHNFEAVQLSWVSDPRDDDLYDRFHSSAANGGQNYSCYASPDCDALLQAYRTEFDPEKRYAIAHQIHRRIAEDQPVTFLYHPQSLVLVSTRLRNVKIHRLGARWHDWWFAGP